MFRFRRLLARRARGYYALYKEEARHTIHERLRFFADKNHFSYNRVAIRDTKRSWGSCSSKGNLNFSYKLLFLSPCLRDYIIVHELCHLHELNHGPQFWHHVSEIMPDYQVRMSKLRVIEKTVGTSVKALQTLQKKSQTENICAYHL